MPAKRFINRVQELMSDQDCETILRVCRDAMDATETVRTNGDGNGRYGYEKVPDHQIRLAGAAMLSSLTLQKPGSRQEVEVSRRVEDPEEVKRRVITNLGGIMSVLEHMKAVQAQTQPVDVTPIEVQDLSEKTNAKPLNEQESQ